MSKVTRLEVWDVQFHENSVDIAWTSNIGFGHLVIYHDNSIKVESADNIKYDIDAECMSENFTLKVIELAKEFVINHMNIIS